MDALINAAARALAAGDPLGALRRVALREDASALALRGIAMAQLGEFAQARLLLRRAARAFGPKAAVSRARCVVAEAEIALASRELAWPTRSLEAARAVLATHGDPVNAAHARNLMIRWLLLTGRVAEAGQALAEDEDGALPPAMRAARHLIEAEVAARRLRTPAARAALALAREAARAADIPALSAEVTQAVLALSQPAARVIAAGEDHPLRLDEIESLLVSDALVIDACRHVVRAGETVVSLTSRPVLLALARALGEAWPEPAARVALIERAFRVRRPDETHRARLRVEIGRLRTALRDTADIVATRDGFALLPRGRRSVAVLAPLADGPDAALTALLADGEAWSSSALALALGTSARTVQRALETLAAAGKVVPIGRGRSRRWTMPLAAGNPTILLLPGPLPGQ